MYFDLGMQKRDETRDQITVDVRLDGRDVKVAIHRAGTAASPGLSANVGATSGATSFASATSDTDQEGDATSRSFSEASGDLTRTTLRMFNELKGQAEKAAAEQGVSLNSFISRAVSDSIRGEKAQRSQRRGSGQGGGRRDHHRGDTTINGYVQG